MRFNCISPIRHSLQVDGLQVGIRKLEVDSSFDRSPLTYVTTVALWSRYLIVVGLSRVRALYSRAFDDGSCPFEPWLSERGTPSQNFHTKSMERRFRLDRFNVHRVPLHGGSSAVLGSNL
ncbi:hypothetical protein TNCV_2304981 [Trichonephila clavipes]|nr:hypothetical protein TNCV_2304981 [Trichonephila clavipes]